MPAHIYKIRVRYNEVDHMGEVHNSIYYIYMELARCDMVRAAGYPYKRMEEDGIFLPVVEIGCTFKGEPGCWVVHPGSRKEQGGKVGSYSM